MGCIAKLAALGISVCLASCGGGGGSSEPVATKPVGTIGGVAFDAELVGATVSVAAYDGVQWFGDSITDGEGRFSVTVEIDHDQVLRISTKGGSFIDEYTGQTQQEFFNQTQGALRMYINYSPGTSIQIAPTIYTTLATYLADYLVEQGMDVRSAVSQANSSLSGIVGVDIETTIPHNVTKLPDAVSTESVQYGLFSAAICALMADQDGLANSLSFTRYAKDDIRDDGLLNESVSNSWNFEGGYRHALAVAMLQMAASNRNVTGLSLNDVLDIAERLNNNESTVFDADDSYPLNAEKPIISNVLWNDSITAINNPLSGVAVLSLGVGDVFGIQILKVYIDDTEVADLSGLAKPTAEIDTSQFSDGDHDVKIVAINVVGYASEYEHKINTANYSTSISNVSIVEGQTYRERKTIYSEVRDPAGITLVEYFIDDTREAVFDDGDVEKYEMELYTPSYADGPHTLRIIATNGVGIKSARSLQFTIDNTEPSVGVWLAENAYIEGAARILTTYEAGADVQLSVSNAFTYYESSGTENGIEWKEFVVNTQTLADGPQQLSISATDRVGNIFTKKLAVIVDNTRPTVRITYPQAEGHIRGEFYLSWTASDANGFGDKPFEILIDGQHYSWVSNWEITDSVNPAIFGSGPHTVSMRATDSSGKITTVSQNVYFDI
jgi:hypothetical protein